MQSGFCTSAYVHASGGHGMPRGAKGSLGAAVLLDAYRFCQRGSGGSLGSNQWVLWGRAEAEKGRGTRKG